MQRRTSIPFDDSVRSWMHHCAEASRCETTIQESCYPISEVKENAGFWRTKHSFSANSDPAEVSSLCSNLSHKKCAFIKRLSEKITTPLCAFFADHFGVYEQAAMFGGLLRKMLGGGFR